MILCIAEKPSVGREIASIVGAKMKRDGYYEGNGYQVTWTFGHLCTLKSPEEYSSQWKKWSLDSLPMIPSRFETKLIKFKGIAKQFKVIKSLVSRASEVINCGDAGIEGELIQRWVLEMAKCTRPVKRLWISSLTEEAIKEGFNNLKPASNYDLLYAAGSARAIGDWLLGMNASRLYTLKFAQGRGVLSIGRVQTPTLALIVERHHEIVNFKPEPYWVLKTLFKNVSFLSEKKKFFNQEEANETLKKITDKIFTITSFQKKDGKEAPPALFDLTSLQVECNKRFGFSADQTLKNIQKLYEKKVVTYPRVDTKFLPSDMYPKVPAILKKLKPYENFTSPLLEKKITRSSKIFNDKKVTDHHAIIPTGVIIGGLPPQEQKIFDTIARRFIAALYPDCKVLNTIVTGIVEDVKFKATGKQIVDPGWRVLYPVDDKSNSGKKDKKESQIIPDFTKGESGPHKPSLEEKETKPPKYYTEATLLRAMETAGKQVDDEELRELMKENGIGRPSTRANIIETLFKRNYVMKKKKALIPAETGIQLISTIKNDLLKSVELTGLWEKKLRQIENGNYEKKIFLSEMQEMVASLVEDVKLSTGQVIEVANGKRQRKGGKSAKGSAKSYASRGKTSASKSTAKKSSLSIDSLVCPKCKSGKIIKGKKAYGCNRFNDGCNFLIPFEFSGKKLSENQVKDIVTKGKTKLISGFIVNGIKSKGVVFIDSNFSPSLSLEKSEIKKPLKHTDISPKNKKISAPLTCPLCKRGEIIKGNRAYGCNRFREGCSFVVPFDKLDGVSISDYIHSITVKK